MFRFTVILIPLTLITSPLSAVDSYWKLPAGQSGAWSAGSNWTSGVPNSSTNAMIANGGTATVTSTATCNNLRLGTTDGSGTVNITGGSLATVDGMAYVGDTGMGSVTQSAGTFSVPPGFGLFMGHLAGSKGTYTLTGGVVSANSLLVGDSGAADFIQSGGTVSAPNGLIMASWDASNATYNLQGGTISVSQERIGVSGTAHFTQTGGTNTVTDSFFLLGISTGGVGIYDLIDGQFSAPDQEIGCNSTGIFTQSGGTNTVGYNFILGNGSNSNGTYNLNGGTLITNEITAGSGTAVFNFGGGTLEANGSFTTTVPMTLSGTGGNANVDTTNGNITLASILSGSGGLNKLGTGTLTLSAANTYRGDTTVSTGTLTLASAGALALDVNNDTNTLISVAPGTKLDLFGTLKLDIGDVTAFSKSWSLVSNSGTTLYEPSFALKTADGKSFTQTNNVWSYTAGSQQWTFMEATGMLSLTTVPEPSSLVLFATSAVSLLVYTRRRRRA